MSKAISTPKRTAWYWLLVLPYIGLLFPQIYARTTPTLWGFPFFYWYQFSWVILSSLITGIVYLKTVPRLNSGKTTETTPETSPRTIR